MIHKKPLLFEYSRIPDILSRFSPITIGAVCLGPFVFARGPINHVRWRHEVIHYRQQVELLFVGMWILYLSFWLAGLVRWRNARAAYSRIPFEVEASACAHDQFYLHKRPLFAWVSYARSWFK